VCSTSRFLRPGCLVLLAGFLISGNSWAASEHEDASIRFDSQLTLSSLLETTLERHPQAGVLLAGQGMAEAEVTYGKHWFPEVMEVTGFHLSDRQLDDIGAYENEVALSMPLWLPGEKKAQTALGEAVSTAQASRKNEFRWRVSATLRRQLWQLMLARRQWELALEQEQRLQDVLEQVTIFTEAGDFSRADQLATMQELAIWKSETMTLEADYQDAVREYQALTGLPSVPADISEALSEEQEIREDHPALQVAMDQLAEAAASNELTRQGNSARPSVQVFWRGFRGDRANPDVNALGLGLAVPLGRSPRRGPEIARANESLARAEARLLETRRRLDLQLHEARHLLKTTRAQLKNSNTMVEAAGERYRLDELAFELGEFSVWEWLRRLSEFKKIERSHELLLMQQGAAIASYNQAAGEIL
jgi:cobalt-zinc-cadmium efflux system outer membrane protein